MGYYKTLAIEQANQERETMRDLTAEHHLQAYREWEKGYELDPEADAAECPHTRSQHYWTCGNCDEEFDALKAEELLDKIIETLRTQPVTASLQQQLLTDMSRVRQIVLCGGIDD